MIKTIRPVLRILHRLRVQSAAQQHNASTSTLVAMEHLDQTQVSYLKEECILVDEQDNIVGSASKGACHRKETAALHRAFSVFLFDTEQRLILQQRSTHKITFPLVWTNSCCSHPLNIPDELDTNNNSIGIRNAAIRKLTHELNINGLTPERLELAGRFLYKADSDTEWMEHELDYVLLVRNFDLPICPNAEEVAEIKSVDRHKLAEMFQSGDFKFSPWFRLMHRSGWLDDWWAKVYADERIINDGQVHKLN